MHKIIKERFELHEDGEVKSLPHIGKNGKKYKGRVISQWKNKNTGYISISLNGKNYDMHRLLAEAFIPNPDNKPEVHHINEDKTDNRLSNLQWVTRKENLHANSDSAIKRMAEAHDYKSISKKVSESLDYEMISKKRGTKVRVWNDNGFSQEYEGLAFASRDLGLSQGNLSNVLNGKFKHTKGYHVERI